MEDHIIRNISNQKNKADKKSEETKIDELRKRIASEKDETLFFVVNDEAHYSPIRNNIVDKFINDPMISTAKNVILLQISATPYSLVTRNSRIPTDNCLNWFTNKEEKSNYFGIQDFLDESGKYQGTELTQLKPGTITQDSTFEDEIGKGSLLQKVVKN